MLHITYIHRATKLATPTQLASNTHNSV